MRAGLAAIIAALMLLAAPPAGADGQLTIGCSPSCAVAAGSAVTFTATLTQGGGKAGKASWDFNGDGLYDQTTGNPVNWQFAKPGRYLVEARVLVSCTKTCVYDTGSQEVTAAAKARVGPSVLSTFDDIKPGSSLHSLPSGVHFPDAPRIVSPVHTWPSSFPSVLSAAGAPGVGGCPSGRILRMRFDHPAVSVSLRAGTDDRAPAAGTWGVLRAFTSAGTLLVSSPDIEIAAPGQYGPFSTLMSVSDPGGRIASAQMSVGCGTAAHNTGAGTAQIDDLTVVLNATNLSTPSVHFSYPTDGLELDGPPGDFSGTYRALSGVQNFCVLTGDNGLTPPDWSTCYYPRLPGGSETLSLHDGRFSLPAPALPYGHYPATVWLRDDRGQVAHDTVTITRTARLPTYGGVIRAVDITQATQQLTLTALSSTATAPGISGPFQLGSYSGVDLVRDGKTIVRVFADLTGDPIVSAPVDAQLFGFSERTGRLVSLGPPLASAAGPRMLSWNYVRSVADERADDNGGFTFVLPDSWTHGPLEVVARLIVPSVPGARDVTDSSVATAAVANIPFIRTYNWAITPIALNSTDTPGHIVPSDVTSDFDAIQNLFPLGTGQLDVLPRQGPVDVTAIERCDDHDQSTGACTPWTTSTERYWQIQNDLLNAVVRWASQNPTPGQPYGLTNGWGSGVEGGGYAHDDAGRLIGGVAHEAGHLLGLPHASAACGGNGEDWPPDQIGALNGVGFDRTEGSGSGGHGYRVLYQGLAPTALTRFYDLMSYCSGGPDPGAGCYDTCSWVSPRNWTQMLGMLRADRAPTVLGVGYPPLSPLSRDLTPSGSRRGSLGVSATIEPGGVVHILSVEHDTTPPTAPAPNGSVRLLARAADGTILADLPVQATPMWLPHGVHRPPALFIRAQLPVLGAASVELREGAQLLARRVRSRHAPKVRLISPRHGRLGSKGKIAVRWSARDPDGGGLTASLSFSSNGGRSYRTLTVGQEEHRILLPATDFSRSRNARLRIDVNDGFNDATATSGRLMAAGHVPQVTILDPSRHTRQSSRARLYLAGQAFDDAGAAISGARLSWFAGGKLLGHGRTLSVRAPSLHTRTITLRARDSRGRLGSARVRVSLFAPRRLKGHLRRHR